MTENEIYSHPVKVISNTILFVYSLRAGDTRDGAIISMEPPTGKGQTVYVPEKRKFSGTNQKPERRRPFGTGLVRHCPQGLFSPFFTFLRAFFARP